MILRLTAWPIRTLRLLQSRPRLAWACPNSTGPPTTMKSGRDPSHLAIDQGLELSSDTA
jgi:hypothetical protein